MLRALGYPVLPYSKEIFGPSTFEEEGKDFHATGFGLSCAAVANYGSILLDRTIVTKVPTGTSVFTDPLVNPVGAGSVINFSQSEAKVILYGGTARNGYFFDGKMRGNGLSDFQRNCFAHEVWRWDTNQKFPEYLYKGKYGASADAPPPITDSQRIRREFNYKGRIDPNGAARQLLRTRDALLKRQKEWAQAEGQIRRAKENKGKQNDKRGQSKENQSKT